MICIFTPGILSLIAYIYKVCSGRHKFSAEVCGNMVSTTVWFPIVVVFSTIKTAVSLLRGTVDDYDVNAANYLKLFEVLGE